MEQLLLHLIGDYITQSDWMAQSKTKENWPAIVHAFVYGLPFILLTPHDVRGSVALTVIIWSLFFIDRYRLARYVVWAKNWLAPRSLTIVQGTRLSDGGTYLAWTGFCRTPPFRLCEKTGYPQDRPAWLAMWLLIIADNTMHLAINYAALRWL